MNTVDNELRAPKSSRKHLSCHTSFDFVVLHRKQTRSRQYSVLYLPLHLPVRLNLEARVKMDDDAAEPVQMIAPLSSRKQTFVCDNDCLSNADISDLMDKADAILSVTPNANNNKTVDLSAYLVPDMSLSSPLSLVTKTPDSLETQKIVMEEDSRELSNLLEYLNDLGFDPSRSIPEAHSHREHTSHEPRVGSTARAPMTPNRDSHRSTSIRTPAQRSVLRERSNHTWPTGAKRIVRSTSRKETPEKQISSLERKADKRHITFSSSPPVSKRFNSHDVDEIANNHSEFDLDASLDELLEETVNAIMSPQKTWQFTEEEWQRLEKVQQMAEMCLREAEHERESARRWARSVHESVRIWVEEQQALAETQSNSLTSDKAQLEVTRDALHRLKLEMEAAANHHDVVKEKLMAVIQQQADTIKNLEGKLKAHENSADIKASTSISPSRVPTASTTHILTASIRVPRISLSPTVGHELLEKQMEGTAPSPVSVIDPITPTKDDGLPHSVPSPMSMTVTPRTQRARATLADGEKLVVYRNGTEKETRPDGTCIIRFPNGDVKCTLGSDATIGIVAYYHAKEKVYPL